MTHDNHEAWVHATVCGVPVPQLLELAVDGKLEVAVRQRGWRALGGFFYDLGGDRGQEFEPDGVPEQLPDGHLVVLQLSDVDCLRGRTTIEVFRVFHADSLVQLLRPQLVTWAMLQVRTDAVPFDVLAAVETCFEADAGKIEPAVGDAAAQLHHAGAARMLGMDPRTLARLAVACLADPEAPSPPFVAVEGVNTSRRFWRWWRSDLKPWLLEVNEWRASKSRVGDVGHGKARGNGVSAGGTATTRTQAASSSANSSGPSDPERRPKRSARSSTRRSGATGTGGQPSGAESKLAELLRK